MEIENFDIWNILWWSLGVHICERMMQIMYARTEIHAWNVQVISHVS